MALEEPQKFVRMCRLCRVVSLRQLPWWPELTATYPWEAAVLLMLANEAGISGR